MPLPAGGYGAPAGPQGIPLADSGLRFAARLLDRIILFFLTCIPSLAISGSALALAGRGTGGGVFSNLGSSLATSVVSAGIIMLYDGVGTGLMGGTLMKKAFGMKVVNQSDGQPVSMQTALLRAAPTALCTLIPILGGLAAFVMGIVSLIFLFSDKLRQTVSDKVAKTVVIKAN
jgi:uncharacterized RDD family membrane protein YckC